MRVDDYEVMRGDDADELGKGLSGIVWRGRHIPTDTIVAVKRVGIRENTREEREGVAKYVMNEVELLQSLRHENIVKLIHYKKLPGYLYIILEYCEEGDLAKFIQKKQALSTKRTVSFLRDISRALDCLHQQNPIIIHRDVKPENMLVFPSSAVETKYIIKLTDLAFSRRTTEGRAAFSTVLGTPEWWAPELRAGKDGFVRYHKESDIFSAGLVFLSLVDHTRGEVLHALTVDGFSVGEWMNRQHLQGLPVTIPIITKASDDAMTTLIKGIVVQMIQPVPQGRCTIQQVCNTVEMAYAIPLSAMEREEGAPLLEVEGATASRGEGATASNRDDGATSRGAGEGAVSSRGTKAATKKTSLVGKLRARFEAASLESQKEGATSTGVEEGATPSRGTTAATKKTSPESALEERFGAGPLASPSEHVQVKKLSHISLPSTGPTNIHFGQDSFIIGVEKDQTHHLYKFSGSKYEPLWTKPIPEGLLFDNYKQVPENLDIYINRNVKEVWRYNEDLKLIDKLPSPGRIIGLLHGGQDALMDNCGQITEEEDVRVSVAPLTKLLNAHHYLDIPRDGAYKRKDKLYACGRQDRRVVVVAYTEPFVDFYSERGRHIRHIRRAQLPHGAGKPGCSDTHVLVPLLEKPQICIFNWSGDLLHTLGREQLGLFTVDRGYGVSPVLDGIFSFWTTSHEQQVHTYQLL